jgi:MFS family permease
MSEQPPDPAAAPRRVLGDTAATALVFVASGAVLVLEILSLRLVAPYVGLTLQVSTAVIGFALAAIAFGAWAGGSLADLFSPQRMLGPLVLAAGALVLLISPLVRWTGESVQGKDTSGVLATAAVAVFLPSMLLAAVTPLVVKLRLSTLEETGRVVGRFSGAGTVGALAGTFATGFLLVRAVPTSRILFALGGLLIAVGAALVARSSGVRVAAGGAGVAALGIVPIALAPQVCDVETAYHCARLLSDPERPAGRILKLDTLQHSYVDLQDPRYLKFAYVRGIAAVLDASRSPGTPVRALHVGGGGGTLARYLSDVRPGSDNLVFEIDRGVVDLDVEALGLRLGHGIDVQVRDGRTGLARQPADSRDFVIGDAFGGVSVPWHLTTREAISDIDRVLTPDGVYVLNTIEYPPQRFVRAEVATLLDVFAHVALISRPDVLAGKGGGNLVIAASHRPLNLDAIRMGLQSRASDLAMTSDPAEVAAFAGDSRVLTDDFAPVDQLLTTTQHR